MSEPWKFSDLPGAVAAANNGKATSRWKYEGRFYRRTHPLPLHPKNRSVLHALHRRFVEEILTGQYEGRRRHVLSRLFPAIDEFYKAAGPRLTPASRQECEQAFSYFLDEDLALEERGIRAHILRRLDEPPKDRAPLARETKRKYLIRVRQFTRWLVESRHLEFNPIDGVEIPPQRRYRKQLSDLFTLEEVARMIAYHRQAAEEATTRRRRRQHIEHAVTIEIVSLLGMRPSEIIRARWEDIGATSWKVWGKAAPTSPGENERTSSNYRRPRSCRDNHASIRFVPIRQSEDNPLLDQWYGRVSALLDELEEFAAGNNGWLIRLSTVKAANRGVHLAMKECDIPQRGRSFRRLRHTARWYMEEYLRLDAETIADVLGHSAAVSFADYRTAPDAETLACRIGDRAAAGGSRIGTLA